MHPNLVGRSLAPLALCMCVGAVAGCASVFGGSDVSCDDLSSSEWKSLANGDRKDEADAIKDCGTLDGMAEAEVVSWMGKPIEKSINVENKNKIESWLIGDSPDNSDLPMISVEYGTDGKVSEVRISNG